MVWAAKNSRDTRRPVSSHVTCLTPFSQKSSFRPSCESGHAQPGQSKPPSSWFIFASTRGPSSGSRERTSTLVTDLAAPHPAAGCS